MACFEGDKLALEPVMGEEQKKMYESVARMIGSQMRMGYQAPPMYSAGPNPGQMAGMDYVMKQLGYGGYQHPGLTTAPSVNVPMTGYDLKTPQPGNIQQTGTPQATSGTNPNNLRKRPSYYF
jgi:hypothetical protein